MRRRPRLGRARAPLAVVGTEELGSAANGVDYLAVPETIVVPAGTNGVTLQLVPAGTTMVSGTAK